VEKFRASSSVIFAKYPSNYQVKKNVLGGAGFTFGGINAYCILVGKLVEQ